MHSVALQAREGHRQAPVRRGGGSARQRGYCDSFQFLTPIPSTLRYKLKAIYSKHYDPESFLCYFVNELTGATQWHRPVGLGQSAEHDIPEVGFELEATPDFVPIETHDLTLAPTTAVAIAEEKSTGYGAK